MSALEYILIGSLGLLASAFASAMGRDKEFALFMMGVGAGVVFAAMVIMR